MFMVYVCIYIYIYIFMYLFMYLFMFTYIYIYLFIYLFIFFLIYLFVYLYLYLYMWLCAVRSGPRYPLSPSPQVVPRKIQGPGASSARATGILFQKRVGGRAHHSAQEAQGSSRPPRGGGMSKYRDTICGLTGPRAQPYMLPVRPPAPNSWCPLTNLNPLVCGSPLPAVVWFSGPHPVA